MNILFFLFQKIGFSSETIGGIERHTVTLIKGLTPKNFHFFFSFSHTDDYRRIHPEIPENKVVAGDDLFISKHTSLAQVREYLQSHHIDVIHIQQNEGFETRLFRDAVEGLPVRIVATYHFMPGYELNDLNFHNSWLRFLQESSFGKKIKWLKRLLFLPYYRIKKKKRMLSKFQLLYTLTDHLVMLSPSSVELFKELCPEASGDQGRKLLSIYNCVSFDRVLTREELSGKRREIVIVSRLEEAYKRLSIAINFWKRIVAEGRFPDWSMTIVGEGYSFNTYQDMIKDVPGITLAGRQPSFEYFARGAIFLNTSKNEGWCLSLTEAMQMGVVPISFGGWKTVFDIIDDGINGFIIPEGDLESYYQHLVKLMDDEQLRHSMAVKAIEKCRNFSRERFNLEYQKLYDPEIR